MLCVNCFRDLPSDVRAQCVDIDTAHAQAAKRLERSQNSIMDLQVGFMPPIISTEYVNIQTFRDGSQLDFYRTV